MKKINRKESDDVPNSRQKLWDNSRSFLKNPDQENNHVVCLLKTTEEIVPLRSKSIRLMLEEIN